MTVFLQPVEGQASRYFGARKGEVTEREEGRRGLCCQTRCEVIAVAGASRVPAIAQGETMTLHPPRRADATARCLSSASQRTFDNNGGRIVRRDHDLVRVAGGRPRFLDAQRLPRQCGVSVNAMWLTNCGDFGSWLSCQCR